MSPPTIDSLQHVIARHIAAGGTVERVESDILAQHPELDEDQRSALWLYAWAQAPGSAEDIPLPARADRRSLRSGALRRRGEGAARAIGSTGVALGAWLISGLLP